jgi:hypothetical protein
MMRSMLPSARQSAVVSVCLLAALSSRTPVAI